jgi:trans-2,3-dihydro-3-hydroxyanthranilate isomerase
MSHPFYIVDVFAEEKFAGNQLAVFPDAGQIPAELMQKIAREINFSETTFITSEGVSESYCVRVFTPNEEIPFAGHPVLGTAYVIHKTLIREQIRRITLNLKAGQVPVLFNYLEDGTDIIWMRQREASFGKSFKGEEIADVIGLEVSDLDARFPIEEVSTGLTMIMVPLKGLDAIKRAKTEKEKYFSLIRKSEAKALYMFSSEPYTKSGNISARMFAPAYGIEEDPATGSAAGCLAGYILNHNYLGKPKICASIEQGFEVGRPSRLYIKGEYEEGKMLIYVGGKVQMVAKGEITI